MNTTLATDNVAERYGINPKLLVNHEPPPSLDVGPPDRAALIEKAKLRVDDFHRLRDAGLVNKSGDFYPSVHYPPIVMYPPMTDDELLKGYTLPSDGMVDVYAHVPFCNSHCVFCHYPVKLGPQLNEKSRYLEAFLKETDIWRDRLGVDRIKARSVLVGGGTPTFLSHDQLRKFLDGFCERVDLSLCRQFNYDVDPNTLIGPEGSKRLAMLREYGVDRLTIGVQSLNPTILKKMGRHHGPQEALTAIKDCLDMGFIVNIEFIFGYPGQTLENWLDVIEQSCQLGVHEIQLYRLKVEAYGDHQGAVKNYVAIKPEEAPTNEEQFVMKQSAINMLAHYGYFENLRRVFSRRRGDYSVYAHNQCCVQFDQIGIGLTAFSSLRDRFALCTQNFDEYYAAIDSGHLPINRGYIRTPEDQARWGIVLPIKNRNVRPANYRRITGLALDEVFRGKIEALKAAGVMREDERALELTPLGAFFADEIAQQFHAPDFVPYPRSDYAEGPLNPYLNQELFS